MYLCPDSNQSTKSTNNPGWFENSICTKYNIFDEKKNIGRPKWKFDTLSLFS